MKLLLFGFYKPDQAQRFVAASGARFVFEACGNWKGGAPNLAHLIGPLVERSLRFGCARVYVLKPTAASDSLARKVGGPGGG